MLPTDVRGKPRAERDRSCAPVGRSLSGLRGRVWAKEDVLYCFVRWAERGIWEGLFSALAGADGAPDRLFIDSIWAPTSTLRLMA